MGDDLAQLQSGINIQLAKMANFSARLSFANYVAQGYLWLFTPIENLVDAAAIPK